MYPRADRVFHVGLVAGGVLDCNPLRKSEPKEDNKRINSLVRFLQQSYPRTPHPHRSNAETEALAQRNHHQYVHRRVHCRPAPSFLPIRAVCQPLNKIMAIKYRRGNKQFDQERRVS